MQTAATLNYFHSFVTLKIRFLFSTSLEEKKFRRRIDVGTEGKKIPKQFCIQNTYVKLMGKTISASTIHVVLDVVSFQTKCNLLV